MAANFKIGQEVTVSVVLPKGPVKALNVNDSGDIQYLVSWVDDKGVDNERWFNEEDIIGAT